jgi:hypothetical protein
MLGASVIGLVLVRLISPYPLVYLLVSGWVLYGIFRYHAKNGQLMLTVLLLLSVVTYPTFALIDLQFSLDNWIGVQLSFMLAIASAMLAFTLFPSGSSEQSSKPSRRYDNALVASFALQNTLVFLPLVAAFIMFEWQYGMLVMIYAAILIPNASLTTGFKNAIGLLLANAFGGVMAIVVFELMVMAPFAPFYLATTLLIALMIASKTFFHPKGALFNSAFSCMLILLTDVSTSTGLDLDIAFYERWLFIALANLYVILAFTTLAAFNHLKTPPSELSI